MWCNSICRICLQNGAAHQIFQTFENNEDLRSKIFLCLQVNIDDIEGYPRKICNDCKETLNTIYDFISKLKESCRILENGLLKIKKEENTYSQYDYSHVLDNKFTISNIKSKVDIGATLNESHELNKRKLKNTKEKVKHKSHHQKICIQKSLEQTKLCLKTIGNEFSKKENIPKSGTNIKEFQEKLAPPPKLCEVCGEIFKDQDKLSLHKKKIHFKNPVKCPECPRICVSEYYLRCHIKRRHEDEKLFECATCSKSFAFKGELSSHYKNVHNKNLKPKKVFACKICNKTYKSARSVVVHERSVHTGDRPAVCTVCGNSFFHKDYLKEHMRLHTGETPFKCPICGRGYAQRCNMKSHLRIHKVSELDENILKDIKPNYIKLLKA